MSAAEAVLIIQTLGLVIFYSIVGLAPGVALGIALGNRLGARDREILMHKHEANMRKADEHNAQWDPNHQRWQK
jgi:hypothetical protein